MAVNPCPLSPKMQYELADGLPAVGNQLFFYVAGSVNTKQNTYTDSTGGVANANPIILNSLGFPTTEIWFTAGQSYKVVYAPSTDTDPPTSPIWSIDNLRGINDTTLTVDQWIAFTGTPTFVSATSFTLVGDQTPTFQVGRRIKSTNSGGTIYSTVSASSFAALTTVTVVNDSGTLDAGLSAVSYGILSASNPSVPRVQAAYELLTSVAGTNTITASCAVGVSAYASGQRFILIPANTNSGATTINISGLGAKNIFIGGAACVGEEIRQNIPLQIVYDGTQFNIVGPYVGGNLPGGQIKFPATQISSSDANTLDDYEEGSWTPSVTFATNGDLNIAYSTQLGTYVKIGSMVFLTASIVTSTFTHTTASGNLQITTLPFTPVANSGWRGTVQWGGITKANYTSIVASAQSASTTMVLTASGSAQALSNIAAADTPTGGTLALIITIMYRAA